MSRLWIRLGFAGFVLLFGVAGAASADDGPLTNPATVGNPPATATAAAGDCDSAGSCGCDNCNCDCCGCISQLWYAGVEGTFLHVTRHGPPAVGVVSSDDELETLVTPNTNDLNSQYGVGPRVWLGVNLGDCWGVRARFWSFKDNDSGVLGNPASTEGESTGSFAVAGNNLSAYTIDLEATKTWGCGPWCVEASLGACYAQMHQDSLLAFFENDDETASFGSASRRVNGTGLTASLEGHRCLGCSGWNVFACARGSVLWGTTTGSATAATVTYFGEDSFGNDAERVSNPTTLTIVETQAGVEWTHPLKCICGTFFVRSAVEYQWWNASNPRSVTAGGPVEGDDVTTVISSTSPSPNVGLIGLNVAAGFRY